MTRSIALLVLLSLGSARGQDAAGVVDRAIKAHGGTDAVTKLKAVTFAAKGRFNFSGTDVDARWEGKRALPERWYSEVTLAQPGGDFRLTFALNNLTGWQKINHQPPSDLTSFAYDVFAEDAYVQWLAQLVALKQKGFTLTTAPDALTDGQSTYVIKVVHDGKPDVLMHFAKGSGLLVKQTWRGKEGGVPVNKETQFAGHRDFTGVRLPAKITDLKDGQRLGVWDVTDYKFPDKLDAVAFKKPER